MTDIRTVQVDLDALRDAHAVAITMIEDVGIRAASRALFGGGTPDDIVNDSVSLGEAIGRRDTIATLIKAFDDQTVRYN